MNKQNKLKNILKGCYVLAVLCAIGLLGFAFYMDATHSDLNQSKLERLYFEGTIQVDGMLDKLPLNAESYAKVGNGGNEKVVIQGNFTRDIEKNEQIFIYIRRMSVKIYKNDILLYSYGEPNAYLPILRSGGNVWGNFYSDGIKKEDVITFEFHNPYKGNVSNIYEECMNSLYTGDRMQLFIDMVDEKILVVVIAFVVFLMGIEMIFMAITISFMQLKGVHELVQCGLLFVAAGIWMLIDFSCISLIFPWGTGWDILDSIVLILIPILAIHYARNYMRTKVNFVLGIIEFASFIYFCCYLLLQKLSVLDGIEAQELYVMALPVILIIMVGCFITELWVTKSRTAKMVLGSGLVMIFFGFLGFLQYVLFGGNGVSMVAIGLVFFVVVQYLILMENMRRNYTRAKMAQQMERELTENKLSLMLSQIQPHFLYNSLSSIQELCLMDPEKAYDTIGKFAHFLRGNMDSLGNTKLIPFEQELKHVKNYLALEEIRFEERLRVEYRLEKGEFLLPPLTLQPIVENAVRYGISKKKEGGTLKISTLETENEIIIKVEDDGVGFDMEKQKMEKDGRSHIGMLNVHKRLEMQCKGRVEVNSQVGIGTVVRIYIPK